MVNKKDELPTATKKKYTMATSRAASVDKAATLSCTGSPARNTAQSASNSSSNSNGSHRLGRAPKGSESPLKQALVIHHANVQQISVNWFKFLAEQREAMKRAEAGANSSKESSPPDEKQEDKLRQRSLSESKSNSPATSDTISLSHNVIEPANIQKAQVVSHSHLIHPKEVLISQQRIQHQPQVLLTPSEGGPESLGQYDELIAQSLDDKKSILSLIFKRPVNQIENLSESILDNKIDLADSRLLVLASITQTDRLLDAINSNLSIIQDPPSKISSPKHRSPAKPQIQQLSPAKIPSESPSVPCRQLALIVPSLLKHLSVLLQTIKHMEDELKSSRIELVRCKSEYGSITSLARDSPGDKDHIPAFSNRAGQLGDVRGTDGEE